VQVKDSFTSCFLLEYAPKQVAFFDACWKDDGRAVEAALEAKGLTPDAVDAVFLTHGHSDHLGGLGQLSGASVYALAAERGLIREEGQSVDELLQDGDEVVLGDHTVHVYSVTGHTRGSAVYEVDGVLLMGDTVIAQKDGSLAPPAERYSEDPAENDASVRALVTRLDAEGVEVEWVAPSHSGPLRGSKALRAY
jgi:glyoxylase-like metal-dependent hydrolase (beta-lactamase superfamily II)